MPLWSLRACGYDSPWVTLALGTENIRDIYKPLCDGNMWTELHVLLEACHMYDIDTMTDIAMVNGRKKHSS